MQDFFGNNPLLLPSILIGLSVLVAGVSIAIWMSESQKRRVQQRLQDLDRPLEYVEEELDVLRDEKLSSIPVFDAMLGKLRVARQIENLLLQADLDMKVGAFVLLTLVAAAAGGLVAYLYAPFGEVLAVPAALLTGSIPWGVVLRKKINRQAMFERQFPDSLDLMVGALRSGMAFTGSLQIVAEESPDPVSKEFTLVFEEQRLGLELRSAFDKMLRRMDSNELRLFVTAVLLQKDMGGNLAEILEGTAHVIRDRFRILGDVKTITAQARLSGMILTFLPLVMAVIILFMAPDYLRTLLTDPAGPYLIGFAVMLQLVGFIAIRKIIAIKV